MQHGGGIHDEDAGTVFQQAQVQAIGGLIRPGLECVRFRRQWLVRLRFLSQQQPNEK